jgi:STE24 endopeptidase
VTFRTALRTATVGERDRPAISAALTVTIAAVGVAATVFRPYAPTGLVDHELATFAPDVLEVVAAYRTPRRLGTIASVVLGVAVPAWFIVTARGRALLASLAGPETPAVGRGAVIALVIVAAVDVVRLPLSVGFGYWHAGVYGFRTSDALGWARDWVVSVTPGWALATAGGAALVWALERWPRSWHWRGAVAGAVLAATVVLVAPVVLEPLWLRTHELPDEGTPRAVREVVAASATPEATILVGDASRRTTRVNAYVSGIGPTRRVVLYDTLLELPDEQVAAVVAHELAHREHRDVERGVALGAVGILATLLVVRRALSSVRAHELVDARAPADPRLVAVAAAVVAALSLIALPAVSHVSRQVEAAADHRALELTGDPETAVRLARTFVVRDLADPEPPVWYVRFLASHPSAGDRVRAAAAYAARNDLPLPPLEEVEPEEETLRHPKAR